MPALTDPIDLGARRAPNRVMFGPIVTNLGDDARRFTFGHTAFYERRARGGCGVIVTEGASVHPVDWPFERAPLAARCGAGWSEIVAACHAHGSLVIASLDHAGGQGSSAYSQRELWAPSRVPEVNSREVPKWMEAGDVAEVVDGFEAAASTAANAGCDGVELNAGQHSLIRQFMSGLTNHRSDEWGQDRLLFARQVIEAARRGVGDGRIVGLRLSCDELAPWAGVTPEMAGDIVGALAPLVDYLVVVRGSIFTIEKTRPDFHEPEGFNWGLTEAMRAQAGGVPVFLQGSVTAWGQAQAALDGGVCDGVEMTRAQLADPDLVVKGGGARPCIRCNQTCQVRDGRNPIITCVVEPSTGHETRDPDWLTPASRPRDVLVVGAGVSGLEAARVAIGRGHRVRVVERRAEPGGAAAVAGPGRAYVDWLLAQLPDGTVATGVSGFEPTAGEIVIQATGSRAGDRTYAVEDGAVVVDALEWRAGRAALPDGTIAVFDPIGGPIGVAAAEDLGERAHLVTQDQIAGNELARTGDLAPANARLQQRGVTIERRSLLRTVGDGWIELEDRFSGGRRHIAVSAVLDCGFRLPNEPLPGAHHAVGDCVAPRTLLEATLEARRVAASI